MAVIGLTASAFILFTAAIIGSARCPSNYYDDFNTAFHPTPQIVVANDLGSKALFDLTIDSEATKDAAFVAAKADYEKNAMKKFLEDEHLPENFKPRPEDNKFDPTPDGRGNTVEDVLKHLINYGWNERAKGRAENVWNTNQEKPGKYPVPSGSFNG